MHTLEMLRRAHPEPQDSFSCLPEGEKAASKKPLSESRTDLASRDSRAAMCLGKVPRRRPTGGCQPGQGAEEQGDHTRLPLASA
jgi:hypothetical protein